MFAPTNPLVNQSDLVELTQNISGDYGQPQFVKDITGLRTLIENFYLYKINALNILSNSYLFVAFPMMFESISVCSSTEMITSNK